MSPLIRSLLALAALLVAADAQSNCNVQDIGQVSTGSGIQLKTVYTPPGGGRVNIPDACASRNSELAGEIVKACNNDDNGRAPDIVQVNPPDFTPVDVVCNADKCPGGAKVDIVQYCHN